jgi:hypothetical protein
MNREAFQRLLALKLDGRRWGKVVVLKIASIHVDVVFKS